MDDLIERVAEAIAMAGTSHFGDDTPYAQQDNRVKMARRLEARAAMAVLKPCLCRDCQNLEALNR